MIEGTAPPLPHGVYDYEGEKYLYNIGQTAAGQPRLTFCGDEWETDLHQAWLKCYGPDVNWTRRLNKANKEK